MWASVSCIISIDKINNRWTNSSTKSKCVSGIIALNTHYAWQNVTTNVKRQRRQMNNKRQRIANESMQLHNNTTKKMENNKQSGCVSVSERSWNNLKCLLTNDMLRNEVSPSTCWTIKNFTTPFNIISVSQCVCVCMIRTWINKCHIMHIHGIRMPYSNSVYFKSS